MKRAFVLFAAATLAAGCSTAPQPRVPLPSGAYAFEHRYAEQPQHPGMSLEVTIRGRHIVVFNPVASGPFPAGVLAEGRLWWHAASGQWIVAYAREDRTAEDVGGCSDGPEVVDLERKIYWTC